MDKQDGVIENRTRCKESMMTSAGRYRSPETRKSKATVVGTSEGVQFSETMSNMTFEEEVRRKGGERVRQSEEEKH